MVWVLHLVSFCGWQVAVKCAGGGGMVELGFVCHPQRHPGGETAVSLKRDWQMRRSAEMTGAHFTSCNVLALEHRPLLPPSPPPPPTDSPQLCVWCAQTGVWELYINSWDYLALIKIHKQVKCEFICSSQQKASSIFFFSCALVIAEESKAMAFRGAKLIGLQITSRKSSSEWTVTLQEFYISTSVLRILLFGVFFV